MFLTDIGYSRFETADPPSHVLTPPHSLESCRSSVASLGAATVPRILGVAVVLGISLVLHGLALVVAERVYAPYSVSRTNEYVEPRHLASASSPSHRVPRHR